jgi:ketosteroid isomerase-like protein
VDIAELKVSIDGDTASARFEQTYESDQPGSRMRTRKTLVLQKVKGRWLIREELRN